MTLIPSFPERDCFHIQEKGKGKPHFELYHVNISAKKGSVYLPLTHLRHPMNFNYEL